MIQLILVGNVVLTKPYLGDSLMLVMGGFSCQITMVSVKLQCRLIVFQQNIVAPVLLESGERGLSWHVATFLFSA